MHRTRIFNIICLLALSVCAVSAANVVPSLDQIVRIKDVARIEGARSNQLFGYGLVVGLDGSGDSQQTGFTTQSIANLLQKFGVNLDAARLKVKNVAAVIVTADLPPFLRPGSKIDVLVSSLGDSRSLQGGTLLQTPLQAANGRTYAVAQGSVSVGGFTAGGGGATVTKNHTTAGRVPGGAIVEQEVPATMNNAGVVNVLLSNPDFATSVRIAQSINTGLASNCATALDAATVQVRTDATQNVTGLVATIGDFTVVQSIIAKVIVNERTGTVVISGPVKLSPVAIASGNLSVEVSTEFTVSQPPPFSKKGETVVVPQTSVSAKEDDPRLVYLKNGSTLDDLVKSLNVLKVTPRDIVAILQALKQAGALHAELEII